MPVISFSLYEQVKALSVDAVPLLRARAWSMRADNSYPELVPDPRRAPPRRLSNAALCPMRRRGRALGRRARAVRTKRGRHRATVRDRSLIFLLPRIVVHRVCYRPAAVNRIWTVTAVDPAIRSDRGLPPIMESRRRVSSFSRGTASRRGWLFRGAGLIRSRSVLSGFRFR
jgi:hypothetical protein